MPNIKTVLDRLAQNHRVQNHLEAAEKAYSHKPFALEHEETYELICLYGFIPSTISILSSSLVFVSLFPDLPVWLSVFEGCLLALFLELLKSFTTKRGFRQYFKGNRFNFLLVGCVILYVLSIGLSSYGSYNGYLMLGNKRIEQVSNVSSIKLDSINAHYSSRIEEAKETARNYFEQVSWKGKISHRNAKTYNQLLEKVGFLESEHERAKAVLETEETQRFLAVSQETKPYLFILIGLALLNELVIFLFGRFKEYYLFKSNEQVEQINQSETLTINLETLGGLAQLVQLQPNTQLSITSSGQGDKIGFNVSGFKVSEKEEKPTVQATRSTTVDKLAPRNCLNCGASYKPSVAWQKYCKKECNHEANGFKLKT